MNQNITQEEINNLLWAACDTFRGVVDPSDYKNYILVILFVKYMSDLWKDKVESLKEKFDGDIERINRFLERERFVIPEGSSFEEIYNQREEPNFGEIINIALEKIEEKNKSKLENVFRNVDFNSEANLGETKERNRRLKLLLEDFHNPKLDFRPSRIGSMDIIGNAYEYLISKFAADAGKKGGEFFTPPEVSTLLAKLLNPKQKNKICDPACGSGSLLIKVGREVQGNNFSLFGQESNSANWALCKMNMFLHDLDGARIERCDTIGNPKLIENDNLMKFDIVVANPPFSLDKWGAENASNDKFNRFWRGTPPKSKGDYAFITHMIEIALKDEGKVGVIVPHGVLFRGGAEGAIRRKLIEENLLEAVIGLPAALFFGTGIPAAILIFNKVKKTTDVLLIDASREYVDAKKQSKLSAGNIEKIVQTYNNFQTIEKYSYRATFKEIQENEFNLNIPRYVDTFKEEEEIDIIAVKKEIEKIEKELVETKKEMDKYLKDLGLS